MLRQIFTLLLFVPIFATGQNDEKALAILKKVSATNEAYKTLKIEFSYTLENKTANVSDTRDGALVLADKNFHLKLMGKDIWSDGKIIWDVMKDDQEVHISSMDDFSENMEFDPANIFRQYEKGYKSKYVGEKSEGGKTVVEIDLFPEVPGKKPYSRIRLGVDKKTYHIVSSTSFGKDGTNYQLKVKSMETDVSIDPKDFIFSTTMFEDAGYDVVDFR